MSEQWYCYDCGLLDESTLYVSSIGNHFCTGCSAGATPVPPFVLALQAQIEQDAERIVDLSSDLDEAMASHRKLGADLHAAAQRIKELTALLYRYRHETPLGHQPHMIAHEVDKALQSAGYPTPQED